MSPVAVEVIPYALPFRAPYVTARGALTRREMALLRLRDADGVEGLGEAVPLSLRGGADLARVVSELERLAETGVDDEAARRLSPPARCALTTALRDLRARRRGEPFLAPEAGGGDPGGEGRGAGDGVRPAAVRCNATLVAGEPASVAEEALRWAELGFETFKLKLGAGDDVAQVAAVREALGPAARIRVDANEAWDRETAIATLRALEPYGIELAEQPVAGLEAMAAVAAAVAVPLAADESVVTPGQAARAAALGACRYTGVKLAKVGGPEVALEVAAALPAYISSALDGPVGIAAAAHVALRLDAGDGPGLAHGLATGRLFAAEVAALGCELRGDELLPPPGPGLGVEIDEDALRAHRL